MEHRQAQADTLSTNAYDNADLASYGPFPNHYWSTNNGGFGYGAWTSLGGIFGGGTYMEGVGASDRQVDGSYSFGLYANTAAGSGIAMSRPLSNSIVSGEFDVTTRFDLTGDTTNLVNLRSGNGTSGFTSGELLAFGLAPYTNTNTPPTKYVLVYRDLSGIHFLPSPGDARAAVWQWKMHFDAAAGTYMLYVTNAGVTGGYSGFITGSLEQSGTSVGSFAVVNSNTGDFQNLVFDSPTFFRLPTNPPPPTFQAAAYLSGTVFPGGPVSQYILSTISLTPWRAHRVEYRTNLDQTNWIGLGPTFTSANSSVFWYDTIATDVRRFYRVTRLP